MKRDCLESMKFRLGEIILISPKIIQDHNASRSSRITVDETHGENAIIPLTSHVYKSIVIAGHTWKAALLPISTATSCVGNQIVYDLRFFALWTWISCSLDHVE